MPALILPDEPGEAAETEREESTRLRRSLLPDPTTSAKYSELGPSIMALYLLVFLGR